MSVLKTVHSGDILVTTKTRVTVDVDDRGRLTISEPARRVISIGSGDDPVVVELEITVKKPEHAAGKTAKTDGRIDDRGRVTIKPPEIRSELGIRGREAVVEVAISKKHNHTGAGS